jgi:nitroreductase
MDMLDILRERHSVRSFTGGQISAGDLRSVIQAGLLAPSSMNRKSTHLVVVKDPATLKTLSKCKKTGAGHVANADCVIVAVGDKQHSDAWIEDACVALTCMHLEAAALGLGSCWVQVRMRSTLLGKDAEAMVRSALGISTQYGVEAMLTLGCKRSEQDPSNLPDVANERVHHERF